MFWQDPVTDPFCPQCGDRTAAGVRFCRSCGYDLLADDLQPDIEQMLVLALADQPSSCSTGCLWQAGLAGAALFLLALLPDTRRSGHRPLAREKACYANIRVLLGAVEMYNMDHQQMITRMDRSTMKVLQEKHYLKGEISSPEPGCEYANDGDLSGNGRITCAIHGGVE
ncbi:MAG: hypothetical protein OZSIB_0241 [Candidatus Ozemobacter sibiricus]|uniref:Zinc-ribbon domain-containing protein n=1 Tax=Candidatus Ozemobacter sibiricus TaxID=2268124 RepID=A0A367ZMP4_9BACT|nr:MAG: hypothetical protein OZSIB_0241 [Candidatus Ozemobacter sibiricus]